MSAIKPRLIIAIEGTHVAVRLVPHKAKADHVVLKSILPEAITGFCEMLGVDAPDVQVGRNFYLAEVKLADLLENMKPFIGELLKLQSVKQDSVAVENEIEQKCPDCGNHDGTHWAFCGQHVH